MRLRGYFGRYVLVGILQLALVGCGLDEAEELLGKAPLIEALRAVGGHKYERVIGSSEKATM
jgi:hypothetical protein